MSVRLDYDGAGGINLEFVENELRMKVEPAIRANLKLMLERELIR